MRAARSLPLLLAALTAGCADPEPFVDQGTPSFTVNINKPRDSVVQSGLLTLCYSDATPWAEVMSLAQERCAAHGLQPKLQQVERQQCRATSPHRVQFLCYDPDMVTAQGIPVNPFDPAAVAAWEKRTGKIAKPHNFMTAPGGPAANPTATTSAPQPPPDAEANPLPLPSVAAPSAQPVLPPLTPDAIADRPALQPAQPRPAAPAPSPAAEAYPAGTFTLPQGSWGDAFQE